MHYKKYVSKWDEWISRTSGNKIDLENLKLVVDRIAEVGTNSDAYGAAGFQRQKYPQLPSETKLMEKKNQLLKERREFLLNEVRI